MASLQVFNTLQTTQAYMRSSHMKVVQTHQPHSSSHSSAGELIESYFISSLFVCRATVCCLKKESILNICILCFKLSCQNKHSFYYFSLFCFELYKTKTNLKKRKKSWLRQLPRDWMYKALSSVLACLSNNTASDVWHERCVLTLSEEKAQRGCG